jgi:hypothetical protein
MAKIKPTPIIVKNPETGKNHLVYTNNPPPELPSVLVKGEKLYFNPDYVEKNRKFYSDLENKAIRYQLKIDPWMDLIQEFSHQLHSPVITVSEFIEKMKENFNLEFKNE